MNWRWKMTQNYVSQEVCSLGCTYNKNIDTVWHRKLRLRVGVIIKISDY